MLHHVPKYRQPPTVILLRALRTLIEGRSDLPGPLSQLGLGRDGTYYVIGAGKCNHAGKGTWCGVTDGNASFIGIEAENTGGADDFPWPDVQLNAYHRGVAAILQHIGQPVDFCAGHKEYALPSGRKSDPDLDMGVFRLSVSEIMNGTAPAPLLIPAVEPSTEAGATPGRPTLRRGATGELVRQIQQKSGVTVVDGIWGAKTEAAVRAFQREHGLVPDGIVGPKTWITFDSV